MKKRYLPLMLALSFTLLAGCGADRDIDPPPTAVPAPSGTLDLPKGGPEPVGVPAAAVMTCRIVDGAGTEQLVLAKADGGPGDVYVLADKGNIAVHRDDISLEWSELTDGMTVEVGYSGTVLETFPAQLSEVSYISVTAEEENDLAGLYLQVLEDLWAVDSGLNEGITQLGVDFSTLEGLNDSEKAAMAYAFGMRHGMMPILGTWEELKEQGYITGEPMGEDAPEDARFWEWKDGCLFSIEGNIDTFTADKWRSVLGAYAFYECSAKETGGAWSYEIGSEMIS